jgi:hypothetical protein
MRLWAKIGTMPATHIIVEGLTAAPSVGDKLEAVDEYSEEAYRSLIVVEVREVFSDALLYVMSKN